MKHTLFILHPYTYTDFSKVFTSNGHGLIRLSSCVRCHLPRIILTSTLWPLGGWGVQLHFARFSFLERYSEVLLYTCVQFIIDEIAYYFSYSSKGNSISFVSKIWCTELKTPLLFWLLLSSRTLSHSWTFKMSKGMLGL